MVWIVNDAGKSLSDSKKFILIWFLVFRLIVPCFEVLNLPIKILTMFFFVFFMWKGIEIWFLETKKALSLLIPVRNLLNLYLIERLLYLEC